MPTVEVQAWTAVHMSVDSRNCSALLRIKGPYSKTRILHCPKVETMNEQNEILKNGKEKKKKIIIGVAKQIVHRSRLRLNQNICNQAEKLVIIFITILACPFLNQTGTSVLHLES